MMPLLVRRACDSFLAPFALMVLTLLLVAALSWRTFDGDQALAGLMAQHLLHGEFGAYPWGQHYFGTLHVIPMAMLLPLFGHESIVALRLPMIAGSLAIMAITTRWTYEVWGRRAALFTAWIMAVPGPYLVPSLNIHPFDLYGIFGMLLVLLSTDRNIGHVYARMCVFGVIAGFGYWLSPSFLEYVVISIVVLMLRSSASLRGCAWLRRYCGAGALLIYALAACGLLLLVLDAHDSAVTVWWGVILSAVAIGFVLFGIFCESALRRTFLYASLLWCLGVVIGNAPGWISTVFSGGFPETRLEYVLPLHRHITAMLHTLLPALAGAEPLPVWASYHALLGPIFALNALVIVWGILLFAYSEREAWGTLYRALPMSRRSASAVACVLMFAIPTVSLTMRYANNVGQIRYLLEAWPAIAMMMGIGLSAFSVRKIALYALVLHVVVTASITAGWYVKERDVESSFRPAYVQELRDFFVTQGVVGGYANYWTALPLNFLTAEQLIFAPYYGSDRRPQYHDLVNAMTRYAFVINMSHASPYPEAYEVLRVSQPIDTGDELLDIVLKRGLIDTYYASAIEKIRGSAIIARTRIGTWDVWILQDHE